MSHDSEYILTVFGTVVLAQLIAFGTIIWWLIDSGGCV